MFWKTFFLLSTIALVPRVLTAFLLYCAEGDAYSYISIIENIKNAIESGNFGLNHLFGVWLPFYQLFCALIELVTGEIYYTPIFVSVIFGTATCLLVYYITLELTKNKIASLIAFLFVAANPLHISYSASSMTDLMHAFLVTLGLYFLIRNRLTLSAISISYAAFTRYESWVFVLVLPILIFFKNKKISLVALLIVAIPICMWFIINKATHDDPFASFKIRDAYCKSYYEFYPDKAKLNVESVLLNTTLLFYASNPLIFLLCVGIFIFLFLHKRTIFGKDFWQCVVFYAAICGFIMLSFLTRNQSDIWVRYGVIVLVLGTPLYASTYLEFFKMLNKKFLLSLLIVFVLLGTFAHSVWLLISQKEMKPAVLIADFIKSEHKRDHSIKIYSDEPSIRILSRLPRESFFDYSFLPKNSGKEELTRFLRENHVKYVVFIEAEYSILPKLVPELKNGHGQPPFHSVLFEKINASQRRWTPRIWLYEVDAKR